MYIGLHVEYSSFLSDFNETRIFSIVFSKNTQTSNSMKIRPVGADLFHGDRRTGEQTDKTKLLVVFGNFEYAPKKLSS